MDTNQKLYNSLKHIQEITKHVTSDWVIIGSAAAHLSGADLMPSDVDFCASTGMVARLIGSDIGHNVVKHGQTIFSNPYATITPPGGLPIDFMGDLSVLSAGEWKKLEFKSRKKIRFDFGDIYIPEIWEQIAILEMFGRDKDLAKLPLLQALL